ncbi:hypothetical protein VTL71DRAFT_13011 [Oculimacula yallundae]|uniref:Uncharacterized protein n=1 Tax=Oculimacula yallundae TaxID=86028 RepID=A0ABR4CRE7_9HELO
MRSTIILQLLATVVATDVIATCARDNCLRAIIATRKPGPSVASADCSSFIKGTTAHALPTYATACSGSARYASACSCMGITKALTSPTPTPTPTKDCSAFYLKIQGATNPNIVYAVLSSAENSYINSFTGSPTQAAQFTLTTSGLLLNNGHIAAMEKNTNLGTIFFPTDPASSNRVSLKCTRSAEDILSCVGNKAATNMVEVCPGTHELIWLLCFDWGQTVLVTRTCTSPRKHTFRLGMVGITLSLMSRPELSSPNKAPCCFSASLSSSQVRPVARLEL